MTHLVIVESPGKVKKIAQILGKEYKVSACIGHFRDLDSQTLSVNLSNFEPIYVLTKPDVVQTLKREMKNCETVYLASDMDREGEAIAQHLVDVLQPGNYSRLTFNSITPNAIKKALMIKKPINVDLVNAQKGRRVIDRLYGYIISPVLRRAVKGSTAAGRVQSVVLKLIVEKECDISQFNSGDSYYVIRAIFNDKPYTLYESLDPSQEGSVTKIPSTRSKKVERFLTQCIDSTFTVVRVESNEMLKYPPPPYQTSTLTSEAARQFSVSVKTVTHAAQILYKEGYITYIRTDSTHICDEAITAIRGVILDQFGKKYCPKNGSEKGDRGAHEAIRPTDPSISTIEVGHSLQNKLYHLIWQRTIASQMVPAKLSQCSIDVTSSKHQSKENYYFHNEQCAILFEGYLIVYQKASAPPQTMPLCNTVLVADRVIASEQWNIPPAHYNECKLIKKMKSLGIGRPSTYANTLSHIADENYVQLTDLSGSKKQCTTYTVYPGKTCGMEKEYSEVVIGNESQKFVPTVLGQSVVSFLTQWFSHLLDYQFTANMETKLDKVARGKMEWKQTVAHFYDQLNPIIQTITASMNNNTNTFLGSYKGKKIYLGKGKYGFYLSYDNHCYSVEKDVSLPQAIEHIKLHRFRVTIKNKPTFVYLTTGKYGLYIKTPFGNCTLPEQTSIKRLTVTKVQAIVANQIK